MRGIFELRYDLFSTYYLHKTCQAVDIMFADSLVEANPYFKFLEVIQDPARYLKFNDNTLVLIGKSDKPELKKSREII